jgi:hypothetical protein
LVEQPPENTLIVYSRHPFGVAQDPVTSLIENHPDPFFPTNPLSTGVA